MFKKLVILSAFVVAPLSVSAQGLPAYPFIHVNGTGSISMMPDLGAIDFEVAASDADPEVALATVNARLAEIRALLAETGIAEADVEIRDVRREIKRSESAEPLAGAIHELRSGVKITIRDLRKWKDVLAPLLAKPNLDGFMTVFDTTEREKVEMDLMAEAIKVARRKGVGMAAGFGRKLGAVRAVSSGELKNLSRSLNLAPSEFSFRGNNNRNEKNVRADLLTINVLKLAQLVDVIFRIQ